MSDNPRKLNELENVAAHIQQSAEWLVAEIKEAHLEGVRSCIDYNEPFLESPLEAIFVAWFHAARTAGHYLESDLDLIQQHSIELGGQRYRVDFIIRPGDVDLWAEAENDFGLKWPGIAIELDGHDYHERTKKQVTHRNRRDRELTKAGWTIFHYSGSELHNKPQQCADEVFQHAWRAMITYRINLYNAKARRRREAK